MLKGVDISHHNKYQISSGELNLDVQDFVIMKATEGKTYKDPMMKNYLDIIGSKPKGFYHYARPENNNPLDEAKHFCNVVGDNGYKAVLALDWEGKALDFSLDWALEWLGYVSRVYRKKPMIYCSSWYTQYLKPLYDANYGLWVAHYTDAAEPTVKAYPYWAIWQQTSRPYDIDVFNGNISQWNKYAY